VIDTLTRILRREECEAIVLTFKKRESYYDDAGRGRGGEQRAGKTRKGQGPFFLLAKKEAKKILIAGGKGFVR